MWWRGKERPLHESRHDMSRVGERMRKTGETEVDVRMVLDGKRRIDVGTGIGFFDHMLHLVAFHAGWDLTVSARGDLHVDAHHTVEDVGIAMGQALRAAVGDGSDIARYGSAYVPLNESLGRAVLDVCGRGHLEIHAIYPSPMCGDFPVELVEEFFRSVALNAAITLHLDLLRCRNSHHGAEVLFKAFGRAAREALTVTGTGVLSTKGKLEG
jgi:imidazoleglycerol-phosphate dehydratase